MPRKKAESEVQVQEPVVPKAPVSLKKRSIDSNIVLEGVRKVIRFCKDGDTGSALTTARQLEEYVDV